MASSRVTSNGPDWKDLAEMISAFEKQNRVRIEVCVGSWKTGDMPDLRIVGKAWEIAADRRVAKPLACQSVVCRAEQIRTMEGLLTFLLYQLDFQLAEHEWESADNQKA